MEQEMQGLGKGRPRPPGVEATGDLKVGWKEMGVSRNEGRYVVMERS